MKGEVIAIGRMWRAGAALLLAATLTLGIVGPGSAGVLRHHGTVVAPQVIVAVGDSITYGLHDTLDEGGWVGRLGARLAQDYPETPFDVVNAGVNGDTSAGVLARLDRDVLSYKPDLVIVSIGTNDFDYGVPALDFQYTLTRLLKRLQASGTVALAVSMLPIAGVPLAHLKAESAYNAIIPRVAAALGVGYLDEFDRWLALGSQELRLLRADAEHPTPLGYDLLAAGVTAFLETQYLSADGQILAPAARPASDLLPPTTLAGSQEWQAVTVQTRPDTRVSVIITSTTGVVANTVGQTNASGVFSLQVPSP